MKNIIYTVDYCPYCKAALKFLKEHNVNFEQVRIDDDEENMRRQLGEKYRIEGTVTVPQIILNGEHIGGYTDMIRRYEKGDLKVEQKD